MSDTTNNADPSFTPGPWRKCRSTSGGYDVQPENPVSDGNREKICYGIKHVGQARLIAAAPDMLAALKAGLSFVSHAADVQDWCGCDDCRTEWALLQQQFQSAIAKAEGIARTEKVGA